MEERFLKPNRHQFRAQTAPFLEVRLLQADVGEARMAARVLPCVHEGVFSVRDALDGAFHAVAARNLRQ